MPDSEEDFLRKLRAAFEVEAREHIEAISAGLLALEGRQSEADRAEHAEIVERTFRAAHSLKGAARSVNHRDIEAICQELETVFAEWKNSGIVDTRRESFDALNRSVSNMEAMLAPEPKPAPAPQIPQAPQTPPQAPAPEPAAAETPEFAPHTHHAPAASLPSATPLTVRVPMERMDALLRQVEEMTALKNAARQRCMDLRDLRQSVRNWRSEYTLLAWTQRGATTALAGSAAAALDQVRGWLAACDIRLGRLEDQLEGDRRALGGMVDNLLEDARTLSILPFSTVLDHLPRLVRELAREEGKMAELSLEGREIELDKRILEQIKDPLLHLVRNCVAHGIEPPEIRRARGKPETGRVGIHIFYRNATQVEIDIRDDGAGLDEARLKDVALAAGLLTPQEAERLSGPAAQRLLFRSGVSTSRAVTEISGRGLGMSIVSERVEELGGAVEVDSRPAEGTLFRILLPVTFATFSGVLVECGRETIVVPVANIERAIRVPRRNVRLTGSRESFSWHDESLPLANLRAVLGIERSSTHFSGDTLQILIVVAGHLRIAFAVDEVHEQMDLLLKPFQHPIVHARNFAAAGLLPTGRAVLILNVAEAIESAIALGNELASAEPEPPLVKLARDVLVVDDSVTSRMLLKNILETAGYRVKTASDGVDALAALHTQRFDLVVTDVQMPRMDGFDLTSRIRADKHLGSIPIVLVTALESQQDRTRGVEAGASAYIVKGSFDESNLLEAVGNLL